MISIMKWIGVWMIFFTSLIESDCKYMSLLNQLDMRNPVIVGTKVIYSMVLATKPFKDREFQFVYI